MIMEHMLLNQTFLMKNFRGCVWSKKRACICHCLKEKELNSQHVTRLQTLYGMRNVSVD